jgi:hypothetical protein
MFIAIHVQIAVELRRSGIYGVWLSHCGQSFKTGLNTSNDKRGFARLTEADK